MMIHGREAPVREASLELTKAVLDIVKRHSLTDGETLRIVGEVLGGWVASTAKYMIREERHGRTDKPGGLK